MSVEKIDLAGLNDVERELLGLLAQGHTIKSIANRLNRSEGSINERLREARRKTGIGSSRELSRILAAQENRHKKTGMESGVGDEAWQARAGRRPAGWNLKGAIVIVSILTAAIAATALLVQTAPGEPDARPAIMENDPLLADMRSDTPREQALPPKQQYLLLRSQSRDESWASEKETVLEATYAALLDRYGMPGSTRVRCAETICEVAFKVVPPMERISALFDALQSKELRDELSRAGLESGSVSFMTATDEDAPRLAHFAYWLRAS